MSYALDDAISEIAQLAQKHLGVAELPAVAPANPKFGADLALPVFAYAKDLGKSPQDIAAELAPKLQHDSIGKTEAAAGFVNIWLSDEIMQKAFAQASELSTSFGQHDSLRGQRIVIEHTDPNPFKEFHIGHAYSNTVGEALGRLYQAAGAVVYQVSYHGDIGKHIAMAIWGIQQLLVEPDADWFVRESEGDLTMADVDETKRTAFLGAAYARGATAYKEDMAAKEQIEAINRHVYAHDEQDIDEIYQTGKGWSFAYFEEIYAQLHVSFEKQYFESEIGIEGLEIVRAHTGDIFEESDGAVVYKGEKVGLHTRVFINSQGLPTYEAKELGLTFAKQRDYNFDQSVVVTANEIDEYFKVLIAAVNDIDKDLANKMRHVSHGVVRLTTGKMSSRTGQVIRAVDVLQTIRDSITQSYDTPEPDAVKLGSLKYAFLKHRIGGDIVFDIADSISLEGNSGPYLQYAHARGQSILAKAGADDVATMNELTPDERALVAKILQYPAATAKAISELAPHHVCTYLYELTQQFNRFYESSRIIGDERQAVRLSIVRVYVRVLGIGLELLNIPAPNKL
jgi:arginyl-tRNA synthetase